MSSNEEYTDGCGTIYQEVIQSLRTSLISIERIRETEGGALIFFTEKEDEGLFARIFPLQKNTPLFQYDATGAAATKNDFLKLLNKEQPYQKSWHAAKFYHQHSKKEHFVFEVPEENCLQYGDGTVSNNATILSWKQFMRKTLDGDFDKNTYEQVFFKSGCNKIVIIPLPVLSTPAILLAVDYDAIKENRDSMLDLIYTRSRDAVSKFLYMCLTDSLTKYLKGKAELISEEELVQQFVNELCKILIPYSYSINGTEEIYYDGWPIEGFTPSTYTLPLLGGRYNVSFRLTSYAYIDFNRKGSEETPFIHTSEMYKAMCNQSSGLVCRMFEMLHQQWELRKTAEETALKRIATALNHINILKLQTLVTEIAGELEDAKKIAGHHPDLFTPNLLLIDGDDITLKVDNEVIVTKGDCKGNNKQIAGFKYLLFILQRSKASNYDYSISVQDLYEQADVKHNTKKHVIESFREPNDWRKDDAAENIKESANGVLEALVTIKNKYGYETGLKRSSGSDVEQAVLQGVALQKIYVEKKLFKYHDQNLILDGVPYKTIFKYYKNQLAKYEAMDPQRIKLKLEKAEQDVKKVYLGGINKHFNKLRMENNNQARKDQVRDSFRALTGKLKDLKETARERKNAKAEKAFNTLLDNLEMAGLIQVEKEEPASQVEYVYKQHNASKHFLEWSF